MSYLCWSRTVVVCFMTFIKNKMVHESRFIQVFIHASRWNKKISSHGHEMSLSILIHELCKNQITIHEKKKRLITLHAKKFGRGTWKLAITTLKWRTPRQNVYQQIGKTMIEWILCFPLFLRAERWTQNTGTLSWIFGVKQFWKTVNTTKIFLLIWRPWNVGLRETVWHRSGFALYWNKWFSKESLYENRILWTLITMAGCRGLLDWRRDLFGGVSIL